MKKIFLTLSIICFCLIFSISFVFANSEDAVIATTNNSIKSNTLTNENKEGNITKQTSAAVKNVMDASKNSMNNTKNSLENYTATQTSAETQVKFAGMTATGWTWFILAILAVLIVSLIWYYASQRTRSNSNNDMNE